MSVYDLISDQQTGKEGTAVYCVGEQLKDILRAGGAAAEKIVEDDLNSGMSLEKCEKAINDEADKRRGNSRDSVVVIDALTADGIIRKLFGLPSRESDTTLKKSNTINLADFI